jgi:hypothetical protein
MVQFTDFSSNGRATGVLADTGYAMPAIEYMWTKERKNKTNANRPRAKNWFFSKKQTGLQ